MNQSLPYILEVGEQEVILTPDPTHEFTATTEQVALGYGVSVSTIRDHKANRPEELVEGKHFLTVGITDAGNGNLTRTLWTKRGIVRLGFFIRSKRARLFRDMAEDLVLNAMNSTAAPAGYIHTRNVARGLGCSRGSAGNRLRNAGIQPIAHYHDINEGYLYSLADVQARWPYALFEAFTGRVLPGLGSVAENVRRQQSALQQPKLLASPIADRVAAAQELARLEARRVELLAALA